MDIGKQIRFFDAKTGEVLRQKSCFFSDWDEEKGYKFKYRAVAVRSFVEEMFPEELSVTDIGRLSILSRHMAPAANMLAKRTRSGYRPMSIIEIGEAVGLGQRQSYNFVSEMIALGMMAKVTIRTEGSLYIKYFLSPVYFLRGKYLDPTLYLLFQEQLDKHLSDDVKQKFAEILKHEQANQA